MQTSATCFRMLVTFRNANVCYMLLSSHKSFLDSADAAGVDGPCSVALHPQSALSTPSQQQIAVFRPDAAARHASTVETSVSSVDTSAPSSGADSSSTASSRLLEWQV